MTWSKHRRRVETRCRVALLTLSILSPVPDGQWPQACGLFGHWLYRTWQQARSQPRIIWLNGFFFFPFPGKDLQASLDLLWIINKSLFLETAKKINEKNGEELFCGSDCNTGLICRDLDSIPQYLVLSNVFYQQPFSPISHYQMCWPAIFLLRHRH